MTEKTRFGNILSVNVFEGVSAPEVHIDVNFNAMHISISDAEELQRILTAAIAFAKAEKGRLVPQAGRGVETSHP